MNSNDQASIHTTVPGLDPTDATRLIDVLGARLAGALDFQLVLKHIHWNVVGPNFIAVHEMLDEHVEAAREMTDEIAERVAILGGTPNGTPGSIVRTRTWDDYPIGRATADEHLAELDSVYDGMIADHRQAIATVGPIDPITEDLLIAQTAKLELFQWFVRSHIESSTDGRSTPAERDAVAAHIAGDGPTSAEERAADRAAPSQPDIDTSYREMTKLGANARGEGQIV